MEVSLLKQRRSLLLAGGVDPNRKNANWIHVIYLTTNVSQNYLFIHVI